ncbi:beta-N-acetylhexosaminidase [Sediminibacterium soli]|uniref:beta-N-acetylhexosaminidase n=1 Tax=Sediminibacterium soli TaxID=2698829 RepID=UPI00137B38FA|nr:beta-N-acetylhexosaminidase [Sediminibacterium soli]NCI46538.1 beta-N-acetylhexosaminidase [Sediminibacterium soli]
MKKHVLLLLVLVLSAAVHAQVSIIPQPASMEIGTGHFTLNRSTVIVLDHPSLRKQADFLKSYLGKIYQLNLAVKNRGAAPARNLIVLRNNGKHNEVKGAYQLKSSANTITISGDDAEGVFYGVQSLIQLLPVSVSASLQVPQLSIADAPRFAYRGMMLDVGRHFFPVEFVKQYIDFLALHKINTFHWHLTEDQGWRIEIKKYPLLTTKGACRNGTILGHHPGKGNDNTHSCGFYTQAQVKEVVKYAADRFITVIPEIEMPGHSSAAIAAYPKLSCFPDEATQPAKNVVDWAGPRTGKQVQQAWGVYSDVFCPSEYTFTFLQDVLDEVMQLFPSKYIHIGGDECPKEAWKRSAFCQQLIKEKGLKDEHGLQSYFIGRIEKYLNSKGHDIIGWDEILEGGLAPNATVMSWRGEKGGIEAAKQKHKVIMTPTTYVYFDYAQKKNEDSLVIGGFLPLDKVYSYNPLPAELTPEEQKYIIGAQANVWTEYMASPSKVEYMVFPRMTALSEVLWSPQELRNWDDFKKRLSTQFGRYDLWKVSYDRSALTPDK